MKAHEETWTVDAWDVPGGFQLGTDGPAFDADDETGLQYARLRLAAQAPAMARLLLGLGAMTLHDERGRAIGHVCQWCEAETRTEEPMTPDEAQACVEHLHDCKLVAVLRAAGVLP